MCQRINPKLQKIGKRRTDHIKGQEKYKSHNGDKTRNGGKPSCQHFIHFHTAHMFTALMWFDDRLFTDLFNKGKTHIRNGGSTVKAALRFHLDNDMFQCFLLIFIQLQLFQYQMITFRQLCCSETDRNTCRFRMIFDQVHNTVQTTVYFHLVD